MFPLILSMASETDRCAGPKLNSYFVLKSKTYEKMIDANLKSEISI